LGNEDDGKFEAGKDKGEDELAVVLCLAAGDCSILVATGTNSLYSITPSWLVSAAFTNSAISASERSKPHSCSKFASSFGCNTPSPFPSARENSLLKYSSSIKILYIAEVVAEAYFARTTLGASLGPELLPLRLFEDPTFMVGVRDTFKACKIGLQNFHFCSRSSGT
jgi:hypothetical protein